MATTICTVCGCKIIEGPTTSCPRCETPHHTDCWTYNAGCGVYACNPHTKAVIVAKPGAETPRRGYLGFALLAGVVGLCLRSLAPGVAPAALRPPPPVMAVAVAAPSDAAGQPWVGYQAPDFAIRDMQGRVQKLSEIRKGRVMVLSFWLARCADCMPHVPDWADLYKRYEENSEIVLVNVAAFATDPEPIREFCKQHGIGGRVLLDGSNQAVSAYQLSTITTFVIDSDGVIRSRDSQAGTAVEKIAPMIDKLVAARSHK